MDKMKVTLSIIWIAVMLTYLLGDVLRIFTGDVTLGEIQGVPYTQGMALGIAALMVIPILMVVLSLVLPDNINRWANMIVAALWIIFNDRGKESAEEEGMLFQLVRFPKFSKTEINENSYGN